MRRQTYGYLPSRRQWCIAKNGGGYTQTGVAKGLKVPCLFMITEVSIRSQKNPEVGIRRIPAYTPNTPLAAGYHRPLTGTKLCCLVTEAHVCEQLAQGCYLKVERPGVEPATFCVASQHPNHYTTRPHTAATELLVNVLCSKNSLEHCKKLFYI